MKHIISGTDRPDSNSFKISQIIQKLYKELVQEDVEIINLASLQLHTSGGPFYGQSAPEPMKSALDQITKSDGLIIVCPEYNGSMPGALKYFIDHMKYPDSFEFRPVSFVGLGGLFGGLRPVEHLQQVFGYRNAFIYPERVFLMNVWKNLKEGQLTDELAIDLLKKQTMGFSKFTSALRLAQLHSNHRATKQS